MATRRSDVDEKRKTKKSLNEAFLRACRHERTPRVVRVVASLETREAVDAVGAGLRGAGYDPRRRARGVASRGETRPRPAGGCGARRRRWSRTSPRPLSSSPRRGRRPRASSPRASRCPGSCGSSSQSPRARPRRRGGRPEDKSRGFSSSRAAENARRVPRAAGSAHGEWTSALMPDDAHAAAAAFCVRVVRAAGDGVAAEHRSW